MAQTIYNFLTYINFKISFFLLNKLTPKFNFKKKRRSSKSKPLVRKYFITVFSNLKYKTLKMFLNACCNLKTIKESCA